MNMDECGLPVSRSHPSVAHPSPSFNARGQRTFCFQCVDKIRPHRRWEAAGRRTLGLYEQPETAEGKAKPLDRYRRRRGRLPRASARLAAPRRRCARHHRHRRKCPPGKGSPERGFLGSCRRIAGRERLRKKALDLLQDKCPELGSLFQEFINCWPSLPRLI